MWFVIVVIEILVLGFCSPQLKGRDLERREPIRSEDKGETNSLSQNIEVENSYITETSSKELATITDESGIKKEEDELGRVENYKVIALLPLTGKFSIIGEKVKNGVLLSANDPRYEKIEVEFIDSNLSLEKLIPELEKIITEKKVSFMIGPVIGELVKEVAPLINRYRVITITLTPKKDVTSYGDTIFRLFHTPESEVETLLNVVPEVIKKVGIIYPDTPYGKKMAQLMEDKLKEKKKNCFLFSYQQGTKNFKSLIEALSNFNPQLLFIPETDKVLSLLIPSLAVGGFFSSIVPGEKLGASGRGVRILLPAVALTRKFVEENKRYLIGSIWTGVYYPPDPEEASYDEFYQRVMTAYSEEPDLYFVRGYDAIAILRDIFSHRPQKKDEILDQMKFIATTNTIGPFGGFNDKREPKIPLWLFMLDKNGRMKRIDIY